MGKTKLTPEKLALADTLAKSEWTHDEIGKHLGVNRATITYALNRRRNPFPKVVQIISAEIVERSISAAQRAIARELRKIASEMDACSGLTAVPSSLPTRTKQ
jgi:hypothetical protein